MENCIFCKIIAGEIPSEKLYEDAEMLAFRDISPAAPVHVLFIPKRHFANLGEAKLQDQALLGRMMLALAEEAENLGIKDGYRIVSNCGESAGQTVEHFHLHLIGGRDMGALG